MPELKKTEIDEITVTDTVEPPSDEAKKVVAGVLLQTLEHGGVEMRGTKVFSYESRVFETPGVVEAFDDALAELETLKQQP